MKMDWTGNRNKHLCTCMCVVLFKKTKAIWKGDSPLVVTGLI